jgi:hypothetical protein
MIRSAASKVASLGGCNICSATIASGLSITARDHFAGVVLLGAVAWAGAPGPSRGPRPRSRLPALLPHLTRWPAMNRPGCGAGCGAGCSWRPCVTCTGVAHWLGAERWCGARLADEAAKTAPP